MLLSFLIINAIMLSHIILHSAYVIHRSKITSRASINFAILNRFHKFNKSYKNNINKYVICKQHNDDVDTGAPQINNSEELNQMKLSLDYNETNSFNSVTDYTKRIRGEDLFQKRDLDEILIERAIRFHDPSLSKNTKETCVLVAVDCSNARRESTEQIFTLKESLQELSELVGTAGLDVVGSCVQNLYAPNPKTYVGSGKIYDIVAMLNATNSRTVVIDDDLTQKQQRNLESAFAAEGCPSVKILDRTAVILDIFAQHARSREGQLQVQLAMLEYRLTRGPKASAEEGGNTGAGFRGPGETKIELDKRAIKEKMGFMQKEIESSKSQRELHRKNRQRLGLPLVALVGYTNAGKSTLLNRLSKAGVLAENMLFATLDPTTRKVRLPKPSYFSGKRGGVTGSDGFEPDGDGDDASSDAGGDFEEEGGVGGEEAMHVKGPEILLTDTVGFISKLPSNLVAAFRATLEEVDNADVLIHVIDRSSPVWKKQRETVLSELDRIGCQDSVIVEVWNKIDALPNADEIVYEANSLPIDIDAYLYSESGDHASSSNYLDKEVVVDVVPSLLEDNNSIIPGGLSSRNTDSDFDENQLLSEDDDLLDEPKTVSSEDHPSRDVSRSKTKPLVRPNRKTFTVAASAMTGKNMGAFVAALEDALSTLLVKSEVFIPYDQDDGIIAAVHQQGAVDYIEYQNTGTLLTCRTPASLASRLSKFVLSNTTSKAK